MNEGDLQAFAGNVGADDAAEGVELKVELLALRYIPASWESFYVEVDCEGAVWGGHEGIGVRTKLEKIPVQMFH